MAVQISFSFFSIEDLIPPLNRLQFDHLGHAACPHTGLIITSFGYIMKYTTVKMFAEEKLSESVFCSTQIHSYTHAEIIFFAPWYMHTHKHLKSYVCGKNMNYCKYWFVLKETQVGFMWWSVKY